MSLPRNPSKARWRKSSYSGGAGACVELAAVDECVAVRDSKDPEGPAIIFSRSAVRGLADRIKQAAL